jgi:uncharacterized peroxidase-related enzyme
MARVRDVGPQELEPEARAVYENYASGYGPFRNQVGIFAHVPSAMVHQMSMLLELRQQCNIPFRYVELAIVATAKLNECDYCVGHHKPLLSAEGISEASADNILDFDNVTEFDEVDRLVISYAIQVTNTPQRIRDGVFERLRAHFTEAQIVELTIRIALCGFYNRVNDALQIESEYSTPPV